MKIKVFLFLLAALALCTFEAQAQKGAKIDGKNLKELAGNWSGELIYLDYGDDKSKITLKVKTQNIWTKTNLKRDVVFTEPNGKEIKSSSAMTIGDDKRTLIEDKDSWRVVKNIFDGDKKQRTIVLETNGSDNNKKALIRKTMVIGRGEYTITKEVRYEGTNDFFVRNEFRFTRAD